MPCFRYRVQYLTHKSKDFEPLPWNRESPTCWGPDRSLLRVQGGNDTKRFVTLVPVLLFASVAIAQEVSFNFERDANFSAFETYAWVEIDGGGQSLDELTANQLKSAVEAQLAMKGLQKADSSQADLLIGYQTALRKKQEMTGYRTDGGYGPGWRTGGGSTEKATILIGSVVLDMYLRSGRLLVWRGCVTKTIDVDAKPDKREKTIQRGVQKLLKNYPPPR